MKSTIMRIALFAILLFPLVTASSYSATEQRTALVIGNSSYSTGSLETPANDADDMAAALKRLGFDLILKKNAAKEEMEDAIRDLGDRLKKGGVGLFFYAGHGVQVAGKNYLLPIGTRIYREADVKNRAVGAEMVLDEMGNAGNNMNIMILDACRDNPLGKSFRAAYRGLAIISSAPRGTWVSYSAGPGNVAADGRGRNSPYTVSLIKHMRTPGLSIEEVFKKVRQDMGMVTKGQQIPWELPSLEGQFYFSPMDVKATAHMTEMVNREQAKKDLGNYESLVPASERGSRYKESAKQVDIKATDGRFLAYTDGTVLDTKTNLMWAEKDNGSDINWTNAKSYCENYRGGGYSDWRMPTQDELAMLHDESKSHKATQMDRAVYLTELIQLSTCCPWASETRGSEAALFLFGSGNRLWLHQSFTNNYRALPVRSGK